MVLSFRVSSIFESPRIKLVLSGPLYRHIAARLLATGLKCPPHPTIPHALAFCKDLLRLEHRMQPMVIPKLTENASQCRLAEPELAVCTCERFSTRLRQIADGGGRDR